MGTSYNEQIRLAEAESKVQGQLHAVKRIEIEIMKHKRKIQDYEKNIEGLQIEIKKSQADLDKVKGGEQ
jgi:peptidoglycan hydrolase CwlO-like protein